MRTKTGDFQSTRRMNSRADAERPLRGARLAILVLSLTLLAAGTIAPASASDELPNPTADAPVTKQVAPREPTRCDVVGTDGNDTLQADKPGLIICGLGGNDTLIGTSGDDILRGGTGDDDIQAGAGNDDLYGGDGTDICRQAEGDGYMEQCEKPLAGIAVTTALAKVGDDYQWGEAGPDKFDCSGLTMYSWRKAGVSLPHSSAAQYKDIKMHVRFRDLEPGDLVFFYKPISHVAMYIGHDQIVHAENEASGVNIDSLSGYYHHHFTGAARPS
jgi:hypothetical protein